MQRIFIDAGGIVLFSAAKILIGCLLAYLLHALVKGRAGRFRNDNALLLIFAGAAAGVILPIDSLALVPIVVVLRRHGAKTWYILPVFISNSLFNMTVPFFETAFQWSLGLLRMVVAIVTGFLGGCLLLAAKPENLIRDRFHEKLAVKGSGLKGVCRFTGSNLAALSLFAVAGAFLYTMFYYDLLNAFKTWFYATPAGSGFARALSRLNLFNGFFMTALSIVDMLINPVWLVSAFAMLRFKGVLLCYLYFGTCSVVLSVTLLIR